MISRSHHSHDSLLAFKFLLLIFFLSLASANRLIPLSSYFSVNEDNSLGDSSMTTSSNPLPTLYEYYTAGGEIRSGLETNSGKQFILNGKPLRILSGSFHYFRLHPNRWDHILKKFRAAGLNTVDLYVPWNLHEPHPGVFDFQTPMLDLVRVLRLIRENDLFVIFRPGPYICAEFEFGGLPAWLLRDPNMSLRSTYKPYIAAVERYFTKLIPLVAPFQFSPPTNSSSAGKGGGPILMVQVDNEFGHFGDVSTNPSDQDYLTGLRDLMTRLGIRTEYFTSDIPSIGSLKGNIPGSLMTANFPSTQDPAYELEHLTAIQPNRPQLISEWWAGWFDFWGTPFRCTAAVETHEKNLRRLLELGASVNFYMFIGGTNWGFTNGLNLDPGPQGINGAIVTSYDYDAPLDETGQTTPKYDATRKVLREMCATLKDCPPVQLPPVPENLPRHYYGPVLAKQILPLSDMLMEMKPQMSTRLMNMENLTLFDSAVGQAGQTFGFVYYRAPLPVGTSALTLTGRVADRLHAFMNDRRPEGKLIDYQTPAPHKIDLSKTTKESEGDRIGLLVENMGRINFAKAPVLNDARKGLFGAVISDKDSQPLSDWEIFSLDFNDNQLATFRSSSRWTPYGEPSEAQEDEPGQQSKTNVGSPALISFNLVIPPGDPVTADTFLYLDDRWTRGAVWLNGWPLGRYWSVGPQRTLYVPGPILREGDNEILVFELAHTPLTGRSMEFLDSPKLGTPTNTVETPIIVTPPPGGR